MMDMTALTVLQLVFIELAYQGVFYSIPALALHRKVASRSLCERFLVYLVAGHVVVINLVFFLTLLHISNFFTMAAAGIALLLLVRYQLYRDSPAARLRSLWATVVRISNKTYLVRQVLLGWRNSFTAWIAACKASVRRQLLSWLLLAAMLIWTACICVPQALEGFGYGASDTVVHNHWINGLIENEPFIDGIYPIGQHCVIYFLSLMTGLPVFTFLRLIGVTMMVELVLVLFAFLRLACKSKFAPFFGVVMLMVIGVSYNPEYASYSGFYLRVLSGLPQEYSMIFILPAIWFAMAYFRDRNAQGYGRDLTLGDSFGERIRERCRRLVRLNLSGTTWELVAFAGAMSLTISCHFYGFFILAVFLAAGAIAYLPRLLHPRCMGSVLTAGMFGLVLAFWPMAVAYAGGTPLQGSLSWGMSVVSAGSVTQASDSDGVASSSGVASSLLEEDGIVGAELSSQNDADRIADDSLTADEKAAGVSLDSRDSDAQETSDAASSAADALAKDIRPAASLLGSSALDTLRSTVNKVIDRVVMFSSVMSSYLCIYCYNNIDFNLSRFLPVPIALLLALGIVLFVFKRQREFALRAITMSVGTIFLLFVLIAGFLNLPMIMNPDRVGYFIVYLMPVVPAMLIDAAMVLIFGWFRSRLSLDASSLLVVFVFTIAGVIIFGPLAPIAFTKQELNGNIAALTRIIDRFEPYTWTIVSANDELRMCEEYGYHTEISELLKANEYTLNESGEINDNIELTFPTEHVFFFVEKFAISKTENGTSKVNGAWVSEQYASEPLPTISGIHVYYLNNRNIEMSRLYYWAQELKRRYPGEVSVLYEDNEFVCYELDQPAANSFNLAFDYGYNDLTAKSWLEAEAETEAGTEREAQTQDSAEGNEGGGASS